jgi:pimeloyl-ACP methyl ester carboxylesterase
VISPDYPGFGNSDTPDSSIFSYTFAKLAEIIGHFHEKKGFDRFGMYVQDYGGPVGFRIVAKKPRALEWLIVQNSNTYKIGFTDARVVSGMRSGSKYSVEGRFVSPYNLTGNAQADLTAHGGEHSALMVYQLSSYRYWQEQLKRQDVVCGQFGENLTVDGLADDEVCIGDRLRIGTVIFEIYPRSHLLQSRYPDESA